MTRKILNRMKQEVSLEIVSKIESLITSTKSNDVDILIPNWFCLSGLKTFDGDVAFSINQGLNVIHAASHHGKTSFLNALFFTLTGNFDNPNRKISYLCSRIDEEQGKLTLRLLMSSSHHQSIEIIKTLTSSGKISLLQLENVKDKKKAMLSSRPISNVKKIEEFLLQSGKFTNKREMGDFYSVFFFSELPEYLLEEKYRGHKRARFLRAFLQKAAGHQQAIEILLQLDSIIKEKIRSLKEVKRSLNNLIEVIDIASRSMPIKEKSLKELIREKQTMEKTLATLLKQKRELFSRNTSRLTDLINKKMHLEMQVRQIESDLTRYSQLSGRQSHEEVACPLCEENVPKSTIQQRLANEYCPLCGVGSLYVDVSDIHSLRQEKARLEAELKRIDDTLERESNFDVTEISELDDKILEIKSEIGRLNLQVDMNEQKKSLKELQETRKQKELEKNELRTEIDAMKRARLIIQEEYDSAMKNITHSLNKRFIQLQNALFDNIMIKISKNFSITPIERSKFLDFSHTERKLLEICFRLAICDVLSTEASKSSFLIIETPEQDLDSSYKQALSEMFASYHANAIMKEENGQKSVKIIISIVDSAFLKFLYKKTPEIQVLPLYQYSKTISKKQQSLLTSFLQ